MNPVFVTGGTGYLGRPLIAALLEKGFTVHALARPGSAARLPSRSVPVIGDALDSTTFVHAVPPSATFVHLIGTPHPSPAKAAAFGRVDLVSIKAAVEAARGASVEHFVYVSVAHPAPLMHAFIAVRQEGETMLRTSGIRSTILRPWYVLGPGHWWPYPLLPVYAILRQVPATREGARRLGLVTRRDMVAALVKAVETPPEGVRIVEVPEIQGVTR